MVSWTTGAIRHAHDCVVTRRCALAASSFIILLRVHLSSTRDAPYSIMKVVDYFSAVDLNGDGRVDFFEALKHCFPHVPGDQLTTLQMWLDPKKHLDKLYHKKLLHFAKEVDTNQDAKDALASIQVRYKHLIQQQSALSDQWFGELRALKIDFVSNIAVARILRKQHEGNANFMKKLNDWEQSVQKITDAVDFQGPNFFPATIFAISSAIKTLSRKTPAPADFPFNRGYKDVSIPKSLGGYCEFGFLSTSRAPHIAQNMASGGKTKHGFVMQIQAPIGGCADIEKYSQCVLFVFATKPKQTILTHLPDFLMKKNLFLPRCAIFNSQTASRRLKA
jgi:hypothetical protein